MHVQLSAPRSAGGLPVTRNMPYSQPSMPSQSQPRNMTGIYLGLEGNSKPPRPKTGVPPLARSRGSSRMRTPTEEQRYRRVELLRIKEEKRGFSGNPVKRHQQPTVPSHQNDQGNNSSGNVNSSGSPPSQAASYLPPSSDGSDPFLSRRWGPGKRIDPGNLDDLLRPNPRNYTTVANSGVTRSEKLTGWQWGMQPPGEGGGPGGGELSSVGGMAREVGRVTGEDLAGLEECFRKVCKGNVEVLYSLLPGRKAQPTRRENTGFTVRSYRNPNRAQILADFSSPHARDLGLGTGGRGERPKTVPIRRPLVPQPYFYRHYSTHPGAASISAATQNRRYHSSSLTSTEDPTSQYFSSTSRILASPGAGTISRSLNQRLQSASTLIPASTTRTEQTPTRHTTSPTGDSDKVLAKGFQSGDSTSRTGQDSEDPAQPDRGAAAGAAGTAGDGTVSGAEDSGVTRAELHVAVVPSARPLDLTTDSNTTTWDDSITPRPPADTTCDSTPRPPSASAAPREQEEEEEGRMESEGSGMAEVKVYEEEAGESPSTTEDEKPRPKLTASNSGADIMLGLETDEGQSAEVEIDTADQEELIPEAEAPKGRVRKASITEKVIKTKASEAMAAMIKEEAESRQREFEKLLDEHAELVQEISRTPSSENLIQGERDH